MKKLLSLYFEPAFLLLHSPRIITDRVKGMTTMRITKEVITITAFYPKEIKIQDRKDQQGI